MPVSSRPLSPEGEVSFVPRLRIPTWRAGTSCELNVKVAEIPREVRRAAGAAGSPFAKVFKIEHPTGKLRP
jgi:hypothetical protein